jgi:uncharacterized protein (TIGR00730 family)
MQRICVYCASNSGIRDVYAEAACELATALVEQNYELVYGGGSTGLMGVLADAVLRLGGTVHGVIPELLLQKEVGHANLTELHVVGSMHERKSKMASMSDAFIALPGGFGTLEELSEILTWGQLRVHDKPVGVINVDGFFDSLLAYLDNAETEGFLRKECRQMLYCADDPVALLEQFKTYQAPTVDKWT